VWDFQKTEQQLLNWAKRQKNAEKNGKTTIWSMKRDNVNEYVHPTQKPVELISYAIHNSSKADDIVMDLFGGSGSTLIACEKTNRICYMSELDPKYCDVIIKRYEDYTGQKALKIA
jgi:DNA modification methylase